MPVWRNNLDVYHGTDSNSVRASAIASGQPLVFAVSLPLCRPYTDFGQGFYVTTYLHQAEQWANKRARTINGAPRAPSPPTVATVLHFSLNRDELAGLESLTFVSEASNFWDLVTDCRGRFPPHQRVLGGTVKQAQYDLVYGPVSLWPQKLVIKDCDQISFHTKAAVAILPDPTVLKKANDSDPKRTLF